MKNAVTKKQQIKRLLYIVQGCDTALLDMDSKDNRIEIIGVEDQGRLQSLVSETAKNNGVTPEKYAKDPKILKHLDYQLTNKTALDLVRELFKKSLKQGCSAKTNNKAQKIKSLLYVEHEEDRILLDMDSPENRIEFIDAKDQGRIQAVGEHIAKACGGTPERFAYAPTLITCLCFRWSNDAAVTLVQEQLKKSLKLVTVAKQVTR